MSCSTRRGGAASSPPISTACAAREGSRSNPIPALLDEVTGLVEFPVVLMGAIDDASMALPPEVLATAMRTHQKYFSCLKPDGTPAPRFLFVANNLTPDDGKTIVAGNERVLRARLSDARFFWDQDRKVPLEDRVEALKERVFTPSSAPSTTRLSASRMLAELSPTYVPRRPDAELSRRARRASPRPISRPAWSVSFPSCKA